MYALDSRGSSSAGGGLEGMASDKGGIVVKLPEGGA